MHLKKFLLEQGKDFFRLQDGEFRLGALPSSHQKPNLEGVDSSRIILEGIRHHYEMDLLAKKFEKIQERKLVCTPTFNELFPQLELSPAEVGLLKRIDGNTTITKLVISEGLDLIGALRLIWALLSLRMVGMVQTEETKRLAQEKEEQKVGASPKSAAVAPEPPPIKEAPLDPILVRKEVEKKYKNFEKEDFFSLLGVDRKKKASEIRKIYFSLAKKFHPDVLASLGLNDLIKKAGSIFAKMTQAHETLCNLEKRREYEASLKMDPNMMSKINDIVQAEVEFQKGEIMLRNRNYAMALQQFEKALSLNPEEAEHFVYVGWSQFLTAKGDKIVAAVQARKMIQKGLSMRGNIDMAYLFMGRIAKFNGDIGGAQKNFNKALEINPKNDQANSEIRFLLKKK